MTNLFKPLRRWFQQRHRPARRPGACQRRLGLEPLEDRTLPSINFGFAQTIAGGGRAVASDAVGDVYVALHSYDAHFNDHGSVAKYSPTGALRWAQPLGASVAEEVWGLAADGDGNVYVTGWFSGNLNGRGTGAARSSAFVEKLDGDGNVVWTNSLAVANPVGPYGIPALAAGIGYGIAVDSARNVYVTGAFTGIATLDGGVSPITSSGNGWARSGFAAKLNSVGTFVWADPIGVGRPYYNDGAEGRAIAVDSARNVYVTGDFSGTVNFNPAAGGLWRTATGLESAFVTRLDANGHFVWNAQVGGNVGGRGQGIAVDSAGTVYATGALNENWSSSNPTSDLFVAKFAADGTPGWLRDVAGTVNTGNALAVDNAGNLYATGLFRGTANFAPGFGSVTAAGLDAFVAKLDSLGNFVWVGDMRGGSASASSEGKAIAADSLGRIYTAGWFNGTVNFNPTGGPVNLSPGGAFLSQLLDTGPLVYTDHSFWWASQSLRLNGPNLEVVDNNTGSVVTRRALAATTNVRLGSTSFLGDSLTVDYGYGGPFLLGGGIQFNPAPGAYNTLALKGNTDFSSETYTTTGGLAGSIAFTRGLFGGLYPPPAPLTYTNVGSIFDTAGLSGTYLGRWFLPGSMAVNVPPANTVYVYDGGMVNGFATTEVVTSMAGASMPILWFANKASVALNGGPGAKTISLDEGTPAAGLTSLAINAGGGGNTVDVGSTAAGVSTTINAGTGHDTIVVGGSLSSWLQGLYAIRGALSINGGGVSAGDTLQVMDQNPWASPPLGLTYSISSNSISRAGVAAITYTNIQNQEIDAGNGNNVFNVYSTAAGTSLTIYTGTGMDTVAYPNGLGGVLGTVTVFRRAR
jgi:hypothetical protein